jgi:hypothetical protein
LLGALWRHPRELRAGRQRTTARAAVLLEKGHGLQNLRRDLAGLGHRAGWLAHWCRSSGGELREAGRQVRPRWRVGGSDAAA